MFESPSITLTALAIRWGCTPQDIAGARPPKAPPLYFAFEGLVIDSADKWTRDGGDDRAAREREKLTQKIAADEAKIKAWTRAGVNEWQKLDSYGKDIGVENAVSVRLEIKNNQTRLDVLREAWEAREVDRSRARFAGHLRATPETLDEIEMRGVASFPRFAVYALHACLTRRRPASRCWRWPAGDATDIAPPPALRHYRKIRYCTIGAILCSWYRHLGETLRRRRISALPENR